MSKNVKVNGKTYEGVNYVKLDLADGSGIAVFEDIEQRSYATETFVEAYVDNAVANAGAGIQLFKNVGADVVIAAGETTTSIPFMYDPSADGLEDIEGVPLIQLYGRGGNYGSKVVPVSWRMTKSGSGTYAVYPILSEPAEESVSVSLYSDYQFYNYSM
jgi:hypothetical protein